MSIETTDELRDFLKGNSVDVDLIDQIINHVEYMLEESYSEGYSDCGLQINGVYQ